jgi:hypothetical protein
VRKRLIWGTELRPNFHLMEGRMSTSSPELLSAPHAEAILELGRRGSGGNFDPQVMGQLFTLGLIEVRNEDRRVGLTIPGWQAFRELTGQ